MVPSFSEWTDRFRVRNDYFKALGEYKLRLAQRDLVKAEAENLRTAIDLKRLLIKQLERDLRALARERARAEQLVQKSRTPAKKVSRLLEGRKLSTGVFADGRAAFFVMLPEALISTGVQEAAFDKPIPRSATTSGNFISVRDDRPATNVPDEVVNAAQLMEWMLDRKREFVARLGSGAQRAVLAIFKAIADGAKAEVAAIRAALESMRAGTYTAWKVDSSLDFIATGAGAKILAAGKQTD